MADDIASILRLRRYEIAFHARNGHVYRLNLDSVTLQDIPNVREPVLSISDKGGDKPFLRPDGTLIVRGEEVVENVIEAGQFYYITADSTLWPWT